MVKLSRSILKQFADTTNDTNIKEPSKYVKGTVVGNGEVKYVKIDGSNMNTPISETVVAKEGDRVLVTVENHKATIVGNFTFPPDARKEQEAVDKAEDAQGTSNQALESAQNAQESVKDALESSSIASAQAGEAIKKAEASEQAANTATQKAEEAHTNANQAKQDAANAKENAADALAGVANAEAEMDKIRDNMAVVQGDIDNALADLETQAGEIAGIKETYSTKVETENVRVELTTEISKKVGELQTTVEQTYASKNEVTSIEGKLQSQITQNAEGLQSHASKIEKVENDTAAAQQQVNQALEDAAQAQNDAIAAQNAAAEAQGAANEAISNANKAQLNAQEANDLALEAQMNAHIADEALAAARTELNNAKKHYDSVVNNPASTKEEIEEAQRLVDAAKDAVTKALEDAATAGYAAQQAQEKADAAELEAQQAQQAATDAQEKADSAANVANNAQEKAEQAQKDVAELTYRVTEAESSITQNAEKIELNVSKTEEIGTKLDNLEIGGRNLALESDKVFTSNKYQIASYYISPSEGDLVEEGHGQLVRGNEYMASICITPAAQTDHISAYLSNGTFKLFEIPITDKETPKQIHTAMFTAGYLAGNFPEDHPSNSRVIFYRFPSEEGVIYDDITVHWVKIEKGNKPTDWTPAPEDLENELVNNYYSKTETDAAIKVESDKITQSVTENINTQINNRFEELDIENRNLALLTNRGKTGWSWNVSPSYETTIEEIQSDRGNLASVLSVVNFTPGEGDYAVIQYEKLNLPMFRPNEYYTVSFDVLTDVVTTFVINICNPDGTNGIMAEYGTSNATTTSKWTKIKLTMKTLAELPVLAEQVLYLSGMRSETGTSYTIENLKIEKGKEATEWTEAPEDLEETLRDEIVNTADQITQSYQSMIEQTSEQLNLLVKEMERIIDGNSDSITSLTNQLQITTEMAQFIKTTTEELKDAVDGKVSVTEIQEWARFDGAELELGTSNSAFKSILTNKKLSFLDGDREVAYISGEGLYVYKAIIATSLACGNFQFVDEKSMGFSLI